MNNIYTYTLIRVIEDKKMDRDLQFNFAKYCVDMGADVCVENNKAIRILCNSCCHFKKCSFCGTKPDGNKSPNIQLLNLLIENGADPCTQNNEPLYIISSYMNCIECAELLINAGANPLEKINSPILSALEHKNISMINFLIDIDPNCIDNNITHKIYGEDEEILVKDRKERFDLLEIFLRNGTDPNAIDPKNNLCLLDKAILSVDLESCKLLIDYGAKVELCTVMTAYTGMDFDACRWYICTREKERLFSIRNYLLDKGLDIIDFINKIKFEY